PFIINIISTIVIILKTARRRSTLQKDLPYKQHIIEQLKQFKHLFISSFLLFILALPRLIIMFAAGCMKTNADSWLFLIGYFLSFVPPMLTFTIFVLPSVEYKQKFRTTITAYRHTIRTRLQLII
ncbi:unnamed protein product, partial [Adineta steineri]